MNDTLIQQLDKILKDFTRKQFSAMQSLFSCNCAMQFHLMAAALGVKKFNQNCSFAIVLKFATQDKDWIVDYIKNTPKEESVLTVGKAFACNVMKLHQNMVASDAGRAAFHILFESSFYGYWIHRAST